MLRPFLFTLYEKTLSAILLKKKKSVFKNIQNNIQTKGYFKDILYFALGVFRIQ